MIPVNIKILPNGKGLKLPEYETRNSAGMDLMAATKEGEDLVIKVGERRIRVLV